MRKLIYCIVCAIIIISGCALWKAKYPLQNKGDIIFSHKKHIEMDAECEACHIKTVESEIASDNNYPKEADCLTCHERENCSLCHQDVENAIHLIPESTGLIFSHKNHLESRVEARELARRARMESINKRVSFVKEGSLEQKIDCLTCHSTVRESVKVADTFPPNMKTCRKCHEVTQDSCVLCHSDLGDKDFVPASHYIGWLDRHQHMSSSEGESLCGNCHRGDIRPSHGAAFAVTEEHIKVEDTKVCADCHRGDIWPEAIHDNNRLQSHGIDALANQNVCNSCHQRNECLYCHERRGISFLDTHPAGWQFNHGDKARRQLSSCVVCHEEKDCLGCHQSISPHPPGWDRESTKQNKHLCSQCHIGEIDE